MYQNVFEDIDVWKSHFAFQFRCWCCNW